MFNPELTTAVEQFAALIVNLPDADLARPWQWKGHDEGLRFAFFVTNLELRQLAVKLADSRTPPQPVHRILSQYHTAYLDLQAALAGVTPADADRAPSEQDWPVRKVLAHIVGADLGFSAVIRYALEGHRAGTWTPGQIPDDEYPRLIGLGEKEYDDLLDGPYTPLLAYHRDLHPRLISEFSAITADELDKPAAFWEDERFIIRYRLHRYEAHMRQHTIQVDKTLAAIGLLPTEAKQLLRMLYNALAEVDGNLIGADQALAAECASLAAAIQARSEEIGQILKK